MGKCQEKFKLDPAGLEYGTKVVKLATYLSATQSQKFRHYIENLGFYSVTSTKLKQTNVDKKQCYRNN